MAAVRLDEFPEVGQGLSYPNDESAFKLLYLALRNIAKKWTMPIRDWKSALNQFAILFEERMPLA